MTESGVAESHDVDNVWWCCDLSGQIESERMNASWLSVRSIDVRVSKVAPAKIGRGPPNYKFPLLHFLQFPSIPFNFPSAHSICFIEQADLPVRSALDGEMSKNCNVFNEILAFCVLVYWKFFVCLLLNNIYVSFRTLGHFLQMEKKASNSPFWGILRGIPISRIVVCLSVNGSECSKSSISNFVVHMVNFLTPMQGPPKEPSTQEINNGNEWMFHNLFSFNYCSVPVGFSLNYAFCVPHCSLTPLF